VSARDFLAQVQEALRWGRLLTRTLGTRPNETIEEAATRLRREGRASPAILEVIDVLLGPGGSSERLCAAAKLAEKLPLRGVKDIPSSRERQLTPEDVRVFRQSTYDLPRSSDAEELTAFMDKLLERVPELLDLASNAFVATRALERAKAALEAAHDDLTVDDLNQRETVMTETGPMDVVRLSVGGLSKAAEAAKDAVVEAETSLRELAACRRVTAR